ncbi:MAG: methyltransferase type 11 [Spirochaetae bacterium HGW-Spirochaetae-1]|jgi:ubiquinone/menaquinone biosynthesis C-methylase UbiE|nr:MAG: methyltransferase type 11 [Spirochaetae bacterium HGW-Spirochaetae-1]
MENVKILGQINKRYSSLAESNCCLSCGGAINYTNAQTGEICLDMGSGRGNDVLRLADMTGPDGFVYGLDVSDGMIEKARKNAEKFDVNNVRFLQSELEIIPVADDHLDLVISNCTINHARDKNRVWKEIFRVLKPGGRFVVSDIYSSEPVPEEHRNDPVAVAECWAGSVTRDEYMEQLRDAGFDNIEIIEESAPYPKGKIEVSSFTIRGYK